MLTDARMACDSKHEHVVRVGFFNTQETKFEDSEKFKTFYETFDVVIAGDGPLTPVNTLLSFCLSKSP